MRPPATYAALAVAAMLQAATASCAYKDIECPAGAAGIEILFEWDRAPRAEVEGMTLFFYPADSYSRIWRFDIAGRNGGRIEIPPGTYRLIACNNDLAGTSVTGTENASTIRAAAARRMDDGAYATTGMLYGTGVASLEVSECGVRYTTADGTAKDCARGIVRCHPDSMATVYTIDIRHVTGMAHIRSASAELEPVSPAILLESGIPAGGAARLYMPLSPDMRRESLTASACAFSVPDMATTAYTLTLRIDRNDGTSASRTVEIGPDCLNILSEHNVLITIADLTIPGSGSSTGDVGGIEAAVDGWQVIEIEPRPAI